MFHVSSEGMTFITRTPGIDAFGDSVPHMDQIIYIDSNNSFFACYAWELGTDNGVFPLKHGPRERFSEPEFWFDVASWYPTDWDDMTYGMRTNADGTVQFRGTADTQYGGMKHEGLCLHGPSPESETFDGFLYSEAYKCQRTWYEPIPR